MQRLVGTVGTQVRSEEVDLHGKLQEIRDRSHWIRSVMLAWKNQQTADRAMRKQYAIWLMILMACQIVAINVVFILIGCGKLTYEAWTAKTFIMAVFGEVAALVLLVVKYLFRPTTDKVLNLGELPRRKREKRNLE